MVTTELLYTRGESRLWKPQGSDKFLQEKVKLCLIIVETLALDFSYVEAFITVSIHHHRCCFYHFVSVPFALMAYVVLSLKSQRKGPLNVVYLAYPKGCLRWEQKA